MLEGLLPKEIQTRLINVYKDSSLALTTIYNSVKEEENLFKMNHLHHCLESKVDNLSDIDWRLDKKHLQAMSALKLPTPLWKQNRIDISNENLELVRS